MLKILLSVLVLICFNITTADTLRIGQAQVKHFRSFGENPRPLNESNEFIDYEFDNRYHIGVFKNSYFKNAPYITKDIYVRKLEHFDVLVNVGIAQYPNNKRFDDNGGTKLIASLMLMTKEYKRLNFGVVVSPLFIGTIMTVNLTKR